ncbi:MAG: GNAT family N-acetyltransferase [Bryobacteraceae bacterium]
MVEIRRLTKHEELAGCVRLQKEIWGFEDIELLPLRLFVVAEKIGGQVLGAFDGEKMVAFCLGIPGLKPGGQYYLHSHMLGVLPEYRNSGLGRQLKLRQRSDALEGGISLIEWTFDPLEIKNAYFNIERLGAIIRRFVHNQYGTTSSHLHGGLPTDRLTAEWWIGTPRAEAISAGQPFQRNIVAARISVPSGIAEIRHNQPGRAKEIQAGLADQFDRHFQAGLAVIGFEKSDTSGTYLLGQWESQ